MNIIEGKLSLNGSEKVAIINSRFNHIITDRLVEGARDAFIRHGGDEKNLDLILVPGAYEIPLALDKILSELGLKLNCALNVAVPASELIRRAVGRRICKKCGATYHVEFKPSKKDGICDVCGGDLYHSLCPDSIRPSGDKEQPAPVPPPV